MSIATFSGTNRGFSVCSLYVGVSVVFSEQVAAPCLLFS